MYLSQSLGQDSIPDRYLVYKAKTNSVSETSDNSWPSPKKEINLKKIGILVNLFNSLLVTNKTSNTHSLCRTGFVEAHLKL